MTFYLNQFAFLANVSGNTYYNILQITITVQSRKENENEVNGDSSAK